MALKEWVSMRRKGGIIGFMLWFLFLIATILFLTMDGNVFWLMILLPIIFPTTPIVFILLGLFFGHKKKIARVLIIFYILLTILWFSVLSYFFYKEHFTSQRTIFFDISNDIQNNLDGCYQQFARESPGKYGYLQCDYKVIFIMGDSPDARKKDIVGQKTTHDCSCAHSMPIF